MTAYEIIRAAIPGAPDELCEHIIWGRTPFPFTKITIKELFKTASRYKRAQDHKIELCDHCDRVAVPKRFMCEVHESIMEKHRAK